jgi:hypothetical protein
MPGGQRAIERSMCMYSGAAYYDALVTHETDGEVLFRMTLTAVRMGFRAVGAVAQLYMEE